MLKRGVAAFVLCAIAKAGNFAPISIDSLAKAPILAVCRVERISKDAGPPQQGTPNDADCRCTAELHVLRAFPQLQAANLQLEYFCDAKIRARFNSPPTLPGLKQGSVYLLPLISVGARWRLIPEKGMGLVAPAIASHPKSAAPSTSREFIIRELANTLAQGTYIDRYWFGYFMRGRQAKEFNDELVEALLAAIPWGDSRWLEISTALLASVAIPRQSLDDLVRMQTTRDHFNSATELLAARTLRKVPEAHRREGVVRNMLRYGAMHEWGSAATLVPEFKDDPLLLELLPKYLTLPEKGAVYTAWWLANSGQRSLLAPSLEAALRVIRGKDFSSSEVYAACRLLLDYGSEEQFGEYLTQLNESMLHDSLRYNELWQLAWGRNSPRLVRILAAGLENERPVGETDERYCDLAGALLQPISKQDFGFTEQRKMPLAERSAAVALARAWAKTYINRPRQFPLKTVRQFPPASAAGAEPR